MARDLWLKNISENGTDFSDGSEYSPWLWVAAVVVLWLLLRPQTPPRPWPEQQAGLW